jgi:predicted nucleic acid-binding Zn ribbon protein
LYDLFDNFLWSCYLPVSLDLIKAWPIIAGMAFQGLQALMRQIERQYQSPAQAQWRQLQTDWPKVVGDRMAAQTKIVSLQKQVLQVAVANPVWVQTLMFERPKLLKRLNACLVGHQSDSPPEPIVDIRFSTAGWHKTAASGTPYETFPGLGQHPCRSGAGMQADAKAAAVPVPCDPMQSFQRWKERIHDRDVTLPTCPSCGLAAPAGELDRWGCCAICFAQADFRSTPKTEIEGS